MSKKANAGNPQAPTPEQWAALYEVAENLKRLMPWRYFWGEDIITLVLPDFAEPFFCSVMDLGEEGAGIAVYPGVDAIMRYHRMMNAPPEEPPYIATSRLHCLTCYFGNREEVRSEDRQVMETLGLRYRGRGEWIYFRNMHPGFAPWFLTQHEAAMLIPALQNLCMVCLAVTEGRLEPDFEDGKTILRFYSDEKEQWLNAVTTLPAFEWARAQPIIDDELLVARLKKTKKTGLGVELDLVYLPTMVRDERGKPPYMPQLAILAGRTGGEVLDLRFPNAIGEEGDADSVISMLTEYVLAYGRPLAVYTRDDMIGLLVEDLCEKMGVELVMDVGIPAVDAVLEHTLPFYEGLSGKD